MLVGSRRVGQNELQQRGIGTDNLKQLHRRRDADNSSERVLEDERDSGGQNPAQEGGGRQRYQPGRVGVVSFGQLEEKDNRNPNQSGNRPADNEIGNLAALS